MLKTRYRPTEQTKVHWEKNASHFYFFNALQIGILSPIRLFLWIFKKIIWLAQSENLNLSILRSTYVFQSLYVSVCLFNIHLFFIFQFLSFNQPLLHARTWTDRGFQSLWKIIFWNILHIWILIRVLLITQRHKVIISKRCRVLNWYN